MPPLRTAAPRRCFVPAQRAVVGVTDRIFTRLGGPEAVASGSSSFSADLTQVMGSGERERGVCVLGLWVGGSVW
jgi:hypothetical protein